MKKVFQSSLLLLAALTVSLSLFAQKTAPLSQISGKLTGENISKIIYLETLSKPPVVVDSCAISDKGTFLLKAKVDKLGFYKLKLDQKNFTFLVLQSSEKAKIEAKATDLKNSAKITGSPHSEVYAKANQVLDPYDLKIDSISRIMRQFKKDKESDSILSVLRKQMNESYEKHQGALSEMIAKNPASPAWLLFTDRLSLNKSMKTYHLLDSVLSQKYPDLEMVKNLHQRLEKESFLNSGKLAPEISLPDTSGNMVTLSSFKGKIVLVDFWASWCSPCRKDAPEVVKMYEKYHPKGLEILGVSLDKDRNAWLSGIKDMKLSWIHVSDLKFWSSEAAKTYRVNSIPFTILVGRDGKIIAKGLRGEELEKKLAELFGE